MIGAAPNEIVFTSCGTESDNAAVMLAMQAAKKSRWPGQPPCHIVTTNVEHPAIEQFLAAQEILGTIVVTRVKVAPDGVVDAAMVLDAIRPGETVLVTIMHSNNEVGSINPVAAIATGCRDLGVLLHTDAAQSCGKVLVDVRGLRVDMLTIVGHKFGAPKGVAALYIRDGCLSSEGRSPPSQFGATGSLLVGGGQEGGRRAGTENVMLIAGLGMAAAVVTEELKQTSTHMAALRLQLETELTDAMLKYNLPPPRVNGPKEPHRRLPNTLSISFFGIDGCDLLERLAFAVAASVGSACHTHEGKVSGVLFAIGVPDDYARGTLRLSVGRHTTTTDVHKAAQYIVAALCSTASHAGVSSPDEKTCATM
jgi:cysteine desulfurase